MGFCEAIGAGAGPLDICGGGGGLVAGVTCGVGSNSDAILGTMTVAICCPLDERFVVGATTDVETESVNAVVSTVAPFGVEVVTAAADVLLLLAAFGTGVVAAVPLTARRSTFVHRRPWKRVRLAIKSAALVQASGEGSECRLLYHPISLESVHLWWT